MCVHVNIYIYTYRMNNTIDLTRLYEDNIPKKVIFKTITTVTTVLFMEKNVPL